MSNTPLRDCDKYLTDGDNVKNSSKGIGDIVEAFLVCYFEAHEGEIPPAGLYERFIQEIEKPLLRTTLRLVKGNQRKAAEVLGINRNTLRKKLQLLDIKLNID